MEENDAYLFQWFCMHFLSAKLSRCRWKYCQDQLSVQCGIHWTKWRPMHSVPGKLLQGHRRSCSLFSVSGKLDLSCWQYGSDQLSVQGWVHGTRRRALQCVCGRKVQDSHWKCRLHQLHRQHVLDGYGCCGGGHLSELSCELTGSSLIDSVSVQCGVHWSRRRHVHSVCAWKVQISDRQCPLL